MSVNRFTRITPREYQPTYSPFPFEQVYTMLKDQRVQKQREEDQFAELQSKAASFQPKYGYVTRGLVDEYTQERQKALTDAANKYYQTGDLKGARQALLSIYQNDMSDPRVKIAQQDFEAKPHADKTMMDERFNKNIFFNNGYYDPQTGVWSQLSKQDIANGFSPEKVYGTYIDPGMSWMNKDVGTHLKPVFDNKESWGYDPNTKQGYRKETKSEIVSREDIKGKLAAFLDGTFDGALSDIQSLSPEAASYVYAKKKRNPNYGREDLLEDMTNYFSLGEYKKEDSNITSTGKLSNDNPNPTEEESESSIFGMKATNVSVIAQPDELNSTEFLGLKEAKNKHSYFDGVAKGMGLTGMYDPLISRIASGSFQDAKVEDQVKYQSELIEKLKSNLSENNPKQIINGKQVPVMSEEDIYNKAQIRAQELIYHANQLRIAGERTANNMGVYGNHSDAISDNGNLNVKWDNNKLIILPESYKEEEKAVTVEYIKDILTFYNNKRGLFEPHQTKFLDSYLVSPGKDEVVFSQQKEDSSNKSIDDILYRDRSEILKHFDKIPNRIPDILQLNNKLKNIIKYDEFQKNRTALLDDLYTTKTYTTTAYHLKEGYDLSMNEGANEEIKKLRVNLESTVLSDPIIYVDGKKYEGAEKARFLSETMGKSGEKGKFDPFYIYYDNVKNKFMVRGKNIIKGKDGKDDSISKHFIDYDVTEEINSILPDDERKTLMLEDAYADVLLATHENTSKVGIIGVNTEKEYKDLKEYLGSDLPQIKRDLNGIEVRGTLLTDGVSYKSPYQTVMRFSNEQEATRFLAMNDYYTRQYINMQKQEPLAYEIGGKDDPFINVGAVTEINSSYSGTTGNISAKDFNNFAKAIMSVESFNGEKNQMGGYGNAYTGVYQLGNAAIADGARAIGINPPTQEELLLNKKLQTQIFGGYTMANHRAWMNDSRYANLSPRDKLKVLAYTHNAGIDNAKKTFNFNTMKGTFRDGFNKESNVFIDAFNEMTN